LVWDYYDWGHYECLLLFFVSLAECDETPGDDTDDNDNDSDDDDDDEDENCNCVDLQRCRESLALQ
jgi:hypothetical protein